MAHRLVLPRGAVRLLRGLVDELIGLHDDPTARAGHGSGQRAWERLYPSTTADPRLDRELRELVHPDLVEGRRAALERVAEALDDGAEEVPRRGRRRRADAPDDTVLVGLGVPTEVLPLDDEQAVALLGVVNDIRLALAATIDLPALLDDDDRLREDVTDDHREVVELVEWLAVVQEQVLATLAPESQAHFHDPVHDRAAPREGDEDAGD